MIYVDTSVLAAYYCPEPQSEKVEDVLMQNHPWTISVLTEVELLSAIAKKVRRKNSENRQRSESRRYSRPISTQDILNAPLSRPTITKLPRGGLVISARRSGLWMPCIWLWPSHRSCRSSQRICFLPDRRNSWGCRESCRRIAGPQTHSPQRQQGKTDYSHARLLPGRVGDVLPSGPRSA